MPVDRSILLRLIDTLPEDAVPLAQDMLERYQTWPRSRAPIPEQYRAMREAHSSEIMTPGRIPTGGGGGSFSMRPGGRGYGSQSDGYWEGDTLVIMTTRMHDGHQLRIEQKLRMADDGAQSELRRYDHRGLMGRRCPANLSSA